MRRYVTVTPSGNPVWHSCLRHALTYSNIAIPAGTPIQVYRLGRDLRARLVFTKG